MSFPCNQCDTSHCQITLLLICGCNLCRGEWYTSRRVCARSWDRVNSTDANISTEKKHATALGESKKIKQALLCLLQGLFQASKGWQCPGFSRRADKPSLPHHAEHTISCLQVKSVRIRTGSAFLRILPHPHHSEKRQLCTSLMVKPAKARAFVLHLRKVGKTLLLILPKESASHRASPATVLWQCPAAVTDCGCF